MCYKAAAHCFQNLGINNDKKSNALTTNRSKQNFRLCQLETNRFIKAKLGKVASSVLSNSNFAIYKITFLLNQQEMPAHKFSVFFVCCFVCVLHKSIKINKSKNNFTY